MNIKCASCKQAIKNDGVKHGKFCEVKFIKNNDGTYTPRNTKSMNKEYTNYLNKNLAPVLSDILNTLAEQDNF